MENPSPLDGRTWIAPLGIVGFVAALFVLDSVLPGNAKCAIAIFMGGVVLMCILWGGCNNHGN